MPHRSRTHRISTIALLESLESRVLFSAGHASLLTHRAAPKPLPRPRKGVAVPVAVAAPSSSSIPASSNSFVGQGYTPAQIRHAYGFDQITFGSTVGDGTGQTIAIIDAYNDPNIVSDLAAFDAAFGIAAPPSFTVIGQDGTNTLPVNAPSGTWGIEESLDVEWAHAMAPGANIILVEANDNQTLSLNTAVTTARNLTGVSVISMSFGSTETFTENGTDSAIFSTPSGHSGITFVASTGDTGPPGEYPAFSKNVVAVGGTSLNLNANNTISSETVWNGTGGGISTHEPLSSYQVGIVTQSNTARTNPDVSFDADPNTGVPIYDSYDFGGTPWAKFGGTSLSAPLFSGLVAIADQGRASVGLTTLDGPTQTLPLLYSLPASDFNDITSGSSQQSNGTLTFSAAPGYDLVTGRGSPIANKVVFGLMGITASISGTVFQGTNSDSLTNNSGTPLANTTVYIDSDNDGFLDPATLTTVSATPNLSIPSNSSTGVTSNITISGTTNTVANITVTVNITHSNDSGLVIYLIAPNGTQIALSNGAGGNGSNFSNTTFSDSAAATINSGTAPFTNGTFRPTLDALADFNGLSANGVWKLHVVYNNNGAPGTLNSWSLNITTGDIYTTTTDANGNYTFNNLIAGGSYIVRAVAPAGFAQSISAIPVNSSNITNQNIITFPPIVNVSNSTNSYYVNAANVNNLEVFNNSTPSGSALFTVPISSVSDLTFNFFGSSNSLTIDFANGNPIPIGNITLNATAASSESLTVLGQNPSQAFTLTNNQIGPTGGGLILFQNLPTLTLGTSTTTLTSDLTSLQNLNLNADESFNFG